ncbi:MAG: M24 family metallopeptidase [Chloroflexi bacterium]|nr:M24 family metallopeptidase [Chloroflexota bacterium]
MSRLQEVERKHERLRELLKQHQAGSLWLQRARNLSWMTAGADVAIDTSSELAPYSILITPEKRSIIVSNIELPRLRKEDHFEDLGFEYAVSNWYAHELPPMPDMISDRDDTIAGEIQRMTWALSDEEQIRYRALGSDTAAALEAAIRAAQPGESEWQIAARLDAACRQRGGLAIVNLVATDDRIAQFRHPYITDKPLDKLVMMVVCMRRGGLICAGTRFAYFGALPAPLRDKQDKVAAIDAAGMSATRLGRTLGDVFAALQAAYTSQGETDQWKLHHQGGMIGYASREHIATPGDPTVIEVGQAYAWNPSIVGCKSEDTILIGADGFDIVTQASNDWPSIEVGLGGQTIRRPAILEL